MTEKYVASVKQVWKLKMFLILQKNNAGLLDSRELRIKTSLQKSANFEV